MCTVPVSGGSSQGFQCGGVPIPTPTTKSHLGEPTRQASHRPGHQNVACGSQLSKKPKGTIAKVPKRLGQDTVTAS